MTPPLPPVGRPLPPSSADPLGLASRLQRRVADPSTSAWVDASAGSGKTRVLVDRVLRLLLSGVPASYILCLTFTKAAAATMSQRLSQELGTWARAKESALHARLLALTGEPPEPETLTRARQLFTRLLDAPGGLQFSTLHGFCQSLLARFPLESGVPVGFRVLDERASDLLLAEATHQVLRSPAPAVCHLLATFDEKTFGTLKKDVVANRHELASALSRHGGAEGAARQVEKDLGLESRGEEGEPQAEIEGEVQDEETQRAALLRARLDTGRMRAALPRLQASNNKTDRSLAEKWAQWLAREDASADILTLSVLTQDGDPRKIPTASFARAHPDLLTLVQDVQHHVLAVLEESRARRIARTTRAFLFWAEELVSHYEALKRRHLALDFNDLIAHARQLLKTVGTPWVLYKLDGGISHVLVDEAQDTNPPQWDILSALTGDFFSGDTARSGQLPARSVFAVGDYKQSIFSFQGADPESFIAARTSFAARLSASGGRLLQETFFTSFRSAQGVLDVVNRVFADPDTTRGLGDAFPPHLAVRDLPGEVEVWPLAVRAGESGNPGPRVSLEHRLADRLADSLLKMKEDEGVPEGDVLILLQRRGKMVAAITRACKARGLLVAGADRMRLRDEIAVMDLLALLSVLLLPDDDLTLAVVLKGPFIGMGEDRLLALASGRANTLWAEVQRAEPEITAWLYALMERADRVSPYALLSGVLTRPCPQGRSGRRALLARLGPESADPVDELLAAVLSYEEEQTPTLQGFVAWMQASTAEIKREMDQAGPALRLMTVHGAKGLEAPVVVLADANGPPNLRALLLFDSTHPDSPPLLVPPHLGGLPASARARHDTMNAQKKAEYRRLLYVAMTRAERRLIVAGWDPKAKASASADGSASAPKRKKTPDPSMRSWYTMIADGLNALPDAHAFTHPDFPPAEGWKGLYLRKTSSASRDGTDSPGSPVRRSSDRTPPDPVLLDSVLPEWALTPPAPEPVPARPLTPSLPEDEEEAPPVLSPVSSPLSGGGVERYRRGLLIHRLLEVMPTLDPATREAAARRWLLSQRLAPSRAEDLLNDVMRLLAHPACAPLFGPHSRAEVPVTGQVGGRLLSGRIDRLAVTPEAVWLVDFKSNRTPPDRVEDVAPLYLRQMAAYRTALASLYPDRPIRTVLIWTEGPSLLEVPDSVLDRHAP